MLTRQDLRAGDIMCQFLSHTIAGPIIAFGQALTGNKNAKIIHAGILFDSFYMIEALKDGITANDLRIQNRTYEYMVFRPLNPALARGAADCANMMLQIHDAHTTATAKGGVTYQTLTYSWKGAVASIFGTAAKPKTATEMDRLLDDILKGKDHPFFCSQFVVYVYQFVAEQSGMRASSLFNLSDPKVPPARLATLLHSSPNFKFLGELLPTVR